MADLKPQSLGIEKYSIWYKWQAFKNDLFVLLHFQVMLNISFLQMKQSEVECTK